MIIDIILRQRQLSPRLLAYHMTLKTSNGVTWALDSRENILFLGLGQNMQISKSVETI